MLHFEIASRIANKMLETNQIAPTYILAGMQTVPLPNILDPFPRSLNEAVGKLLLRTLCKEHDIVVKSVERREGLPIRGAYVYQHNFVTPNGEFNCVEVAPCPDNSHAMLWRAMVEMGKQGCMVCAFGQAELEEGMVCPNCKGNKLRKVLTDNGIVRFKDAAWPVFLAALPPERAKIMEQFMEFDHNFWMNEEFCKEMDRVIEEAVDSPEFGEYLGLTLEQIIFQVDPNLENE